MREKSEETQKAMPSTHAPSAPQELERTLSATDDGPRQGVHNSRSLLPKQTVRKDQWLNRTARCRRNGTRNRRLRQTSACSMERCGSYFSCWQAAVQRTESHILSRRMPCHQPVQKIGKDPSFKQHKGLSPIV